MEQMIRLSNILIGRETVHQMTRKNKTSIIASPDKCVQYFHHLLEYPVVGKSLRTGKASLGKKNIFKLRLKQNNPVLDICLRYRETAKETGSLKFIPWRDNQGKLGVDE